MTGDDANMTCCHCEEPIPAIPTNIADQIELTNGGDLAWHKACLFRQAIGSVAHMKKECSCYGGISKHLDPPEMTRREAARAAWDLWHEIYGVVNEAI